MNEFEVQLKIWGGSVGIIIPYYFVRAMQLKAGDTIVVKMVKKDGRQ
jgi:antitoxin component of MazEF toxin-antitoxin module